MDAPAPKRQKLEPKGVQETDVGITSFIGDLPGFSGILKSRYSDFQVNEISNGKVVVLTDFGSELEKKQENPEETPAQVPPPPKVPEISEFREALEAKLGKDLVDQVHALFGTGTKVESTQAFTDKQERTELHKLCAEAWNNRLETETLPDGRLAFRLKTRHSRKPREKAKREGTFLRFAVYKENKETMEVASLIARLLRVPNKGISFAGTKDRRGVTTQLFAVRHMSSARVSSVNHALKGVRLGNFHYSEEPLRLGDLDGNQFYIAIRDVKGLDHVDAALEHLKEHGFINYFGLQRFGTFSVSTHAIGRLILAEKYQEAVDSLCGPQQLSSSEDSEARAAYAAGDLKRALELMPRRCQAEHSLLSALQDSPSAINAILRIPRNLKLMYVHAYQSFIWNSAASKRIKDGLKIQMGDLVYVDDGPKDDFQRARPVTQEEIDSGAKTIYDVVLPTPGFDVAYPANVLSVYESLMQQDDIDCHKMRRNTREFSLSGSYRLLLAKPEHVEWWKTSYKEENDQLVRTDAELVENKTESKIVEGEGPLDAVLLKLSLGSSQYATMALREVMKVDTSRHGELFFGAQKAEPTSETVSETKSETKSEPETPLETQTSEAA